MAREGMSEEIEEHLTKIEEQGASLSGLFDEHGLTMSEAPIGLHYVALDEIRDAIQLAIGEG